MLSSCRLLLSLLTAALLAAEPCFAFQSPLSDQSVREAYFLGQRRDESMSAFLSNYTKFPRTPKSGPYAYRVSLFTPFALLVDYSRRQSDYSAQQAALDHKSQPEAVVISIEVLLTASYGAFVTRPANSHSGSSPGTGMLSSAFWRAFKYRVFDGAEEITTDGLTGEPNYLCSRAGCLLTGATVRLEFPAEAFTSDSATIEVDPPQGEPVSVDFDLSSLR